MFKKINRKNKKGFTLAELLIVVAIIGVLVAISIPIFTSQLEKSREATDLANIRSAYAEASVEALDNPDGGGEATTTNMTQQAGWTKVDNHIAGVTKDIPSVKSGDKVKVTVSTTGVVDFEVIAGS